MTWPCYVVELEGFEWRAIKIRNDELKKKFCIEFEVSHK